MELNEHTIGDIEDKFVLSLLRRAGTEGNNVARQHTLWLQELVSHALSQGKLERAVGLAERAFEFNCRSLGLRHSNSKASMRYLKLVKQHV